MSRSFSSRVSVSMNSTAKVSWSVVRMPTLSIGAVLPEKRLLIRVPRAGLRVMMPALSSRAKARRTVIRLQPASRAKSRSAGSRSPVHILRKADR
ncbi:MAG: hypothetical protein L6W00_24430 [Lentisphaeria bacterium]|nr:MAG: hypothetical protein L6W00_24430 [Lentisphaeria bacterium]